MIYSIAHCIIHVSTSILYTSQPQTLNIGAIAAEHTTNTKPQLRHISIQSPSTSTRHWSTESEGRSNTAPASSSSVPSWLLAEVALAAAAARTRSGHGAGSA